jgi:hypothetical protein
MVEEFKVIKDFENYSVSNFGNVRNDKTGRILKTRINNKGYKQVDLWNNGEKKTMKIHRLIAETFISNPDNKTCVDHKDNDRLNNNIENLRWSTFQENSQNTKLSIKNSSGIKGISFDKKMNKWSAYIQIDGKKKHLGYFENIEDAKNARQKFANKIFGEYTNACEKIIIINHVENFNLN